jgi:hypothetical protein
MWSALVERLAAFPDSRLAHMNRLKSKWNRP